MKTETLNYECQANGETFEFHGDNLRLAVDHIAHYMRHIGIREAKFREIGADGWHTVELDADGRVR